MSHGNSLQNPFLTAPIGALFLRTATPIVFVMSMNGLLTVMDAVMLGLYADRVGRKPALMLGDLQSQLASLEVGAASIRRLAQRYGAEGLLEATARILDMSEAAMRAAIRAMPDGTYEFEDFLDDDGVTGEPVRLHAVLTVQGDGITVDLTGCADQQRGPINCTPAMSNCAVYYAIIAATDGAMPANAGCYRPVTIIHREGSVTSCRAPASVAHRVAVSHRLANVMFGCLHQALPDRMPAAYYGGSYVATFQTEGEDGSREVLVEIEIGGTGASPTKDGVNAWSLNLEGGFKAGATRHRDSFTFPHR